MERRYVSPSFDLIERWIVLSHFRERNRRFAPRRWYSFASLSHIRNDPLIIIYRSPGVNYFVPEPIESVFFFVPREDVYNHGEVFK